MGAYLRAARSRRRVSIDRAAEQTRIRADFLMRMESDEFDFLAPAYVRGFLKTYARFLRVEPERLVGLMARDKKALRGTTFVLDGPKGVEPVTGVDERYIRDALEAMRAPLEMGEVSPEGVAQALAGEPLEALYVTPLCRTPQTAAPLAARTGLEPVVVAELREAVRRVDVNDRLREYVVRIKAGRPPYRVEATKPIDRVCR